MFSDAHSRLYHWYLEHGRHDLPWRNTRDPYPIWVSEVMLQQTQVKTVLERFYYPFLETFPTLQELADADLDDVLKRWEGLGYYTRARNLHRTARLTAPELPQSVTELNALPGIGRSTAHAIAAFAYRTPVPILDANVKRILYRLFARTAATDRELWELAHTLFDAEHPFEYNQAMMDLGSMVCTRNAPSCGLCPYEAVCKGQAAPLEYPAKKGKKPTPLRRRKIVIHSRNGKIALQQRTSRFLHGLWGFSEYEEETTLHNARKLGDIVHIYSHFRLEAEVFVCDAAVEGHAWFPPESIAELALSGADHKAFNLYRSTHAE